jgi:hypothetical protein
VRQPWTRLQAWWQPAADDTDPRRVAAYRLLACWTGLFLFFFTISATKLPNYALPALVPTAILIARFLERWRLGELCLPSWVLPSSLACLALAGVGLGTGMLAAGGALPLDVMRGQPIDALRPWSLLGLCLVAGGAMAAWCLRRGLRTGLIMSIAAGGVPLLALLGGYGMAALETQKSARMLVADAGARQRDLDIRVAAWQLDHLPSLNFYVQRNVQICATEADVLTYLRYPVPVYVFLPAAEWDHLRSRADVPWHERGRRHDLYKHGDVVVISNR